jgi:hypothetical protein
MARRRARVIPKSRGPRSRVIPKSRSARPMPRRGRPTSPRGRGRPTAPRGRGRPTPRGRGRPTSPLGPRGSQAASKSPRGRAMASKSPRGRAMARMSPSQVRSLRARSPRARGPQGPRSRATSRPTINPGQGLRNFIDTMPRVSQGGRPRAPRGPMSGVQLSNRNRMQQQMMEAARANMAQGGRRGSLFGAMGNVPQRPIPNRDGRMAQMQAAQARAQRGGKGQGIKTPRPTGASDMAFQRALNQRQSAMREARQRPPSISMDPSKGTFGKGMRQSDYMRQQMPPQQIQRGMGRGPMQRANIGQVQAPRPTFNQQINQSPRGRRGRIIPRRR